MGKEIRLVLSKEFNTVSKIHKQRNNIHLDNSQIKKNFFLDIFPKIQNHPISFKYLLLILFTTIFHDVRNYCNLGFQYTIIGWKKL